MTSTTGSTPQSASRTVTRAAVITHGKRGTIGPALARLATVAREAGVELLVGDDEAAKHEVAPAGGNADGADVAVVLGGDGTMLRALGRYLGTGVPVIGVNFGRVGFLSSIPAAQLETGVARVFAGDFTSYELPTLEVDVGAERRVAVNDLVVTSAEVGRMIQLEWAVGGEGLGRRGCDGVVCSTPSGSTGYNFSNGGPVLTWGLDAMCVTFVAPHSLNARPLVVARGTDLIVWNRTPDVTATALVDGHRVVDLPPGGRIRARIGDERSLLATLPEVTFFSRYTRTFAS
ncbi:MAG: NAD(+)/NADH kinase [Actinobacteria bacterium]|nr:NAD(+)/NADH kinase [Actinomycetota bacterium]